MEDIRQYEISGDDARVAYPLFQKEDGGSTPTSPLQFTIYEISIERAKRLNKLWHSRLPNFNTGYLDSTRVRYGAFFEAKIYAIAIWGIPSSPSLPAFKWLELKRMAIAPDAPKNTASRMIKIMIGLIKKKFPDVTMLISYQDTEAHEGTIYKASSWEIGRYHKGAKTIRHKSRQNINPDNIHGTALVPKIRWQKEIRLESS